MNSAQSKTARTDEQRQIPNGAEFRRARNPELREIPKSGTPDGEYGARFIRRWVFRPSGFRALWNLAPYGIWRSSEFGAFSRLRRSAVAPFELYQSAGSRNAQMLRYLS